MHKDTNAGFRTNGYLCLDRNVAWLCDPVPFFAFFTGIMGTYQGLTATVLKQGSNQAIRFFVMTSLRNWYKGLYLT